MMTARTIEQAKVVFQEIFAQSATIPTPVEPTADLITNPIRKTEKIKVKRTKAKTSKRSDDPLEWQARDLVNYFAAEYKTHVGLRYVPHYSGDTQSFNTLFQFFTEQKMNPGLHGKNFIDWCFQNRVKNKRLCPKTIPAEIVARLLNIYMQESIDNIDENESILEQIIALEQKSKILGICRQWGIVVALNYVIKYKKANLAKTQQAFAAKFAEISTTESGVETLRTAIRSTIAKEPYPEDFDFRDWREAFDVKQFKIEPWWTSKPSKTQIREDVALFANEINEHARTVSY